MGVCAAARNCDAIAAHEASAILAVRNCLLVWVRLFPSQLWGCAAAPSHLRCFTIGSVSQIATGNASLPGAKASAGVCTRCGTHSDRPANRARPLRRCTGGKAPDLQDASPLAQHRQNDGALPAAEQGLW